jgi:hypothetical protein
MADDLVVLALVRDAVEHVAHRLDPGALLVVALHDRPRRVRQVGEEEHRLLGLGVLSPLVERREVDRAELPPLHRVELPVHEPAQLLGSGHREPELDQEDAVPGQHPLEFRRLAQELHALIRPAEAHHALDPGPVVPRPVEHDDLAGRRQMSHVALQVPLGLLALGGLLQGHDPGAAGIEVLGEPLDRAALAGRVPALKDDDQPPAGRLDVPL